MLKLIRIFIGIYLGGTVLIVNAGHGFMNSFEDVEWLPEPGTTPDQIGYRLDNWHEQASLAIETDPQARYALCLEFAREKLAEIEAMVIAVQSESAGDALEHYANYLETAETALTAFPADQLNDDSRLAFAKVLLEHQYILSVNYLDLPKTSRPVMFEAMKKAGRIYGRIAAQLEHKVKESLFFKEEEVRWSTELAEQADIQGI